MGWDFVLRVGCLVSQVLSSRHLPSPYLQLHLDASLVGASWASFSSWDWNIAASVVKHAFSNSEAKSGCWLPLACDAPASKDSSIAFSNYEEMMCCWLPLACVVPSTVDNAFAMCKQSCFCNANKSD